MTDAPRGRRICVFEDRTCVPIRAMLYERMEKVGEEKLKERRNQHDTQWQRRQPTMKADGLPDTIGRRTLLVYDMQYGSQHGRALSPRQQTTTNDTYIKNALFNNTFFCQQWRTLPIMAEGDWLASPARHV